MVTLNHSWSLLLEEIGVSPQNLQALQELLEGIVKEISKYLLPLHAYLKEIFVFHKNSMETELTVA